MSIHSGLRGCWALAIWAGLGAVVVAGAEWGIDEVPEGGKRVRIVYLNPADRECQPHYQERLDRVMTDIQAWYRDEMQRNGFGAMTFPLERDADGKLVIHVVQGTRAYADGEEITSGEMRDNQVKPALAERGIDIDREHIIIFANTVFMSQSTEEEGAVILRGFSHYCGTGDNRRGTAWVTDTELLDTRNLPREKPKVLDGGTRPYTLGGYVVTYVGGVAHEFGHALGLPHNRETPEQLEELGYALMGSGNYHLFGERAGRDKGSYLSQAHATILSTHPLFTRSMQDIDVDAKVEWRDLSFAAGAGEYVVRGRVTTNLPAYAVVAYHDGVERRMDYDATSWVGPVSGTGRFEVRVGALAPGEYQLRLRCYLRNNTKQQLEYRFALDDTLKLPVAELERQTIYELHARPAIAARDAGALAGAVEKLAGTEDALYQRARAYQRLWERPETPGTPLAEIAADVTSVALSTVAWESAEVGWERPMVDRIGTQPLESGARFHDQGIYAHAHSRFVYKVDGQWRRFVSGYGLQNHSDGSVVFVVKCDGVEKFRSPMVKEWTEEQVEIDLTDVTTLELIVEDGDNGKWGDAGIWFAPRLER